MIYPMSKTLSLNELIEQASHLSPPDKLRLVEVVQEQIERQPAERGRKEPKPSLWGALAHLGPGPSEEDVREVRRQVWAGFPRDDV
jgi:hypothetical protein